MWPSEIIIMLSRSNSKHDRTDQVNIGQCCPVPWNFQPPKLVQKFDLLHTCKVEKPPRCTNQSIEGRERDMWWDDDVQMRERSLLFIHFVEGEETHPLGFMSLHFTQVDLDNLCMRENKFKIPFLLVRMRSSLYQNWTSLKEESNAIIISII